MSDVAVADAVCAPCTISRVRLTKIFPYIVLIVELCICSAYAQRMAPHLARGGLTQCTVGRNEEFLVVRLECPEAAMTSRQKHDMVSARGVMLPLCMCSCGQPTVPTQSHTTQGHAEGAGVCDSQL